MFLLKILYSSGRLNSKLKILLKFSEKVGFIDKINIKPAENSKVTMATTYPYCVLKIQNLDKFKIDPIIPLNFRDPEYTTKHIHPSLSDETGLCTSSLSASTRSPLL